MSVDTEGYIIGQLVVCVGWWLWLRGARVDVCFFFFSSRRRHTRCSRDWSSDVCSSDLEVLGQHVGSGDQTVDQERAEQDRHGGAAGDAEGDGRNERAALLGIIGALGRDNADRKSVV